MMRFSLSRMAEATGGRMVGDDVEVLGMIHDARRVQPGNVFCALPGERHDGHEFLEQARGNGAAAALVAREVDDVLPQLVVEDVREAMGRLARAWRDTLDVAVVGITGSNGKTTVKEMTAAILSTQGATLATEGNYNNELGVPLTLARLDASHRFAVIEMGCNRPGDIAYLAGIARPDVGVVTNAGPAHLERLGSVEGVARTKGEMFSGLPDEGTAVINADDDYAPMWREMAGDRRIISFGMTGSANVSGVLASGLGHINTPAGDFEFAPVLPGRHNFYNALAATAAAVALEVPLDDIADALARMKSLPGRLQFRRHPDGWQILDDTYNANPASLYAALQVMSEMGGDAHWLVLGDMGELGPDGERLHAEMGQAARDLGVSRLFTIGELARASSDAFDGDARHFASRQALIDTLAAELHAGVTCLVKGSRSMGMERVVAGVMGEKQTC
ncbi:UDP-N-acetylmuramoyl-tripeptide--D-alanyl-D-alanine ligase [Wenzhouxiangella sediminis]|uniref:UDP-N-acetylmuramoyl-tripeptide--D-alanyl-D-alanine ligase n=1 Tax=Wenzhouxiangella sediminis TaxID=1792836 RepID=A0A3E1K6W1_9GAMM|nr:UDP-N-acetylmuramoyl-tripeptide--D-alanyl-D-alanine ligase [Wenzhouxiangella sediminis]RFF29711.1 UDP-N-acetylmuramoyl-tripeptide--D-alanyl-D-alanine ligase [Wenzhouxiangella sediminis]